jgi:hypothetical protein
VAIELNPHTSTVIDESQAVSWSAQWSRYLCVGTHDACRMCLFAPRTFRSPTHPKHCSGRPLFYKAHYEDSIPTTALSVNNSIVTFFRKCGLQTIRKRGIPRYNRDLRSRKLLALPAIPPRLLVSHSRTPHLSSHVERFVGHIPYPWLSVTLSDDVGLLVTYSLLCHGILCLEQEILVGGVQDVVLFVSKESLVVAVVLELKTLNIIE